MQARDLAKALGFNKPDWRLTQLLTSANQYGLVVGQGKTAHVRLDEIGEGVVAPSSADQRKKALLQAFRNVEKFHEVERFYRGKKIPEDEFFENTLVRHFKIGRDRIDTFKDVFFANIEYLKLFRAGPDETRLLSKDPDASADGKAEGARADNVDSGRVREFLDTCFVMMPFGEWFDRYYKEIYSPAIKEAGYEPVRADELFTTGSVVEQV